MSVSPSHPQPQDAARGRAVALELIDVTYSYVARKSNFEHGIHQVLDGVSLKLFRGQTLGIVGRNGAGKTTLLRLMAGVIAPRSGQVLRDPSVRCSLLSLGLGFQPNLTGSDNAQLAALLQGASREEARDCLESVKEFSGLGASFNEPVKTYSAGMKARLGFATALQTQVEVLLVDEVLSVGDLDFRKKAYAAMRERLVSDQTVVLVSHSEQQIAETCDSAVWIENGQLSAYGDVDEVFGAYRG